MKYLALLSVMLCPGFATAKEPVSPPKPIITCEWPITQSGLITVGVGEILQLSGRMSEADHWKWRVTPEETGQGLPTYRADQDGQGITVATRPGIYVVHMMVSNAAGIDDRVVTVRVIDGTGAHPPPTLPPVTPTVPPVTPTTPTTPTQPPVTPVDPEFPGRFQVGRDVYNWAMAVNSPTRVTEARALANAARSVMAGISSPKPSITTIAALIAAIQTTNAEVMRGKNAEAWRTFSDNMKSRVVGLITSGAVSSMTDGKDLLEEIAVALERVTQ